MAWWQRSRVVPLVGAATFLVLVVVAVLATRSVVSDRRPAVIPTARVQRGTLAIRVYAQGELRCRSALVLTTPPVGSATQILGLKPSGTSVTPNEVVVEFDPAEQEYAREQAESEVAEVEAEIKRTQLNSQVEVAQDQISLLSARFSLKQAELDVAQNELLSEIDARKNQLALEEAKRRLAQLEKDAPARRMSAQAGMAVLTERRAKAQLRAMEARRALEALAVRAPAAGIVSLRENTGMGGGIPGMGYPEFAAGDTVYPGAPIAEIVQLDQVQVQARVDEADRSSVHPGQSAEVRFHAVPARTFEATVKSVAALAARGALFTSGGSKGFDMVLEFRQRDPALRPGMTGEVVVAGSELRDVLLVPRQALIEREGQGVVYVRVKGRFEPRQVTVTAHGDSLLAIQGLAEGTEFALVSPERRPEPQGADPRGGRARPSGGGGGGAAGGRVLPLPQARPETPR